jgi:hypothetical protein
VLDRILSRCARERLVLAALGDSSRYVFPGVSARVGEAEVDVRLIVARGLTGLRVLDVCALEGDIVLEDVVGVLRDYPGGLRLFAVAIRRLRLDDYVPTWDLDDLVEALFVVLAGFANIGLGVLRPAADLLGLRIDAVEDRAACPPVTASFSGSGLQPGPMTLGSQS